MALNIKDIETEQLVSELAARTGESKTAAVRAAVRERLEKVAHQETPEERYQRFHQFLAEEIWPQIPPDHIGKPMSKEEQEEILGIGPDGV